MAQAPATPKWRRFLINSLSRLGLSTLAHRLDLAESEKAALRLRKIHAEMVPATRKQVTFLIPLVGADQVGDWTTITDRLLDTLRCFLEQDDPHWQVIICCQDEPPLPKDPRITWLPFTDWDSGNDKWRKLATLYDHLTTLDLPPGYVMSFDADDLMRQGVVREMLGHQAPGGYLVETGLVMDESTGDIALAGPRTRKLLLRKPFWKLCGSCAALAHDPDVPESTAFLKAMTAHDHRMFPYLASLAGQRLTPFERPSVLYVLNHGENFGARRGRVSFKTRFVQRFKIEDQIALADIARDFPKPRA
jgi:hypothetical protein